VEELGKVDYEEAIKKRNQTVYVPNWFSVDIKTGVSGEKDLHTFLDFFFGFLKLQSLILLHIRFGFCTLK